MKIKNFVEAYKNKDFSFNGCLDAWYDWFCTDKSLINRTKRLANTIKKVYKSLSDLNYKLDNFEVSLKNCCPCSGPTYDRISIFTDKTDYDICIVFNDHRADNIWEVYDYNKSNPLVFGNDSVKGIPEAVVNAIKYHIKASE